MIYEDQGTEIGADSVKQDSWRTCDLVLTHCQKRLEITAVMKVAMFQFFEPLLYVLLRKNMFLINGQVA